MIGAWLSRPLWQRIIVGFVLGIAAGMILGQQAAIWLKPLGDVYVNLMRMIVVPLVLISVSASMARLGKMHRAVTLFARTMVWFVITSACAVAVGVASGVLFSPGAGLGNLQSVPVLAKEIPSVIEVLVNIFPANPVRALAEGNLLQILFLAMLLGAALSVCGDKVKGVRETIEHAEILIFRITSWIVQLTPLGTFGLIAWVTGQYGLTSLVPLGKFIAVLYGACLFHMVVVYGAMLKMHGLSARKFFRSVFAAQQMAFATASSMATLPLSLRITTERLGVAEAFARFVMPFGATVKMDGCGAIYPALAAIFIAQHFGVTLTLSHYVLIVVTTLIGSLATAGVPGTSLVMLTLTLSQAGLPLEGIGYIIAIDRVVDMIRTATNVTGQMLVAVVVAQEEHLLDQQIYDSLPVALSPPAAVTL